MTITASEWVLAALTTARLTWLIVNDQITQPIRTRIRNRAGRRQDRGLAFLVTCPWCSSVWISLPVLAWVYLFSGPGVYLPLGVASLSMVAALLVKFGED